MIGALKGKIDRCSREIERKGSVSMRRDDNFYIVLKVRLHLGNFKFV